MATYWDEPCEYDQTKSRIEWAYDVHEGNEDDSPGLSFDRIALALTKANADAETITKDMVQKRVKRYREGLLGNTERNDATRTSLTIPALTDEVLRRLKNTSGPVSVYAIADELNVPCNDVRDVLRELKQKHHYLVDMVNENTACFGPDITRNQVAIDVPRVFNGRPYKFGAIGDTHLCFPGSTPVRTERGDIPICNIQVGDKVLTHKNRFRSVTDVVVSECDGTGVRLRFRGQCKNGNNDYASLTCTPNHPVRVVRDGVEGWVPAGDIREGDHVRMVGDTGYYDYLDADEYGFVAVPVRSVEIVTLKSKKVYNLIVDEDETYVAERCVVHNCSKYERLDALHACYDIFEQEGINHVFLTGNFIEGECRFNKHEIHVHGLEAQVQYFIQNFPHRDGITTFFVAGDDHEGWFYQREGIDVGLHTQMVARQWGRDDLVYLGYMERDVCIVSPNGKTRIRVVHPGGGSAYAVSYTAQKLVESYSGGEKPDILLMGHYHKAEMLPAYRNVYAIQTGTLCDQSPFMRKKRLAADVGGWVCTAHIMDDGTVTRLDAGWIRFFDRSFTERKWSHKGVGDTPRYTPKFTMDYELDI
jgi:hypothetical protein